VEYSRQPGTRKPTRGEGENEARGRSAIAALALPNIAELIDYGEITVGVLRPIGCVVIASDEGNTWPC